MSAAVAHAPRRPSSLAPPAHRRHAGHAAHFLQRLDRVDPCWAELALALDRDPALVEATLAYAKLPDSAERVAISLEHPRRGPFILVTREGHFVTCLGRDLRPRHPVVTRAELDEVGRAVPRLREVLAQAEAAKTNPGRVRRLMARVLEGAEHVSREQMQELLRGEPLLDPMYLGELGRCARHVLLAMPEVRNIVRPRARHEELLFHYHRALYALGHLYVLAGASPAARAGSPGAARPHVLGLRRLSRRALRRAARPVGHLALAGALGHPARHAPRSTPWSSPTATSASPRPGSPTPRAARRRGAPSSRSARALPRRARLRAPQPRLGPGPRADAPLCRGARPARGGRRRRRRARVRGERAGPRRAHSGRRRRLRDGAAVRDRFEARGARSPRAHRRAAAHAVEHGEDDRAPPRPPRAYGRHLPVRIVHVAERNDRCPCGSGRKLERCCPDAGRRVRLAAVR